MLKAGFLNSGLNFLKHQAKSKIKYSRVSESKTRLKGKENLARNQGGLISSDINKLNE